MSDSTFNSLSSDQPDPPKKKKERVKVGKDVNEVLRDALASQLLQNSGKVYKEDCAKAVSSTLQEFLQAFVLIGYDFQGTPIRIVCAHNGQEADALTCALQKFMMQSMRMFDE